MSCDERHAHRAAGQAIAAVLVGAPIERVSTNGGSVVEWSPLNPPTPIDSRIRAQIFVLLTGVGAEQRYSFGVPPGDAVWLMPSADQPDLLRDIEQADALSIDLSSLDNSLEMVWQYAAELVCQDDAWCAIELIAERLMVGMLNGREVLELCCSVSATD
jgi:hypothetical protein